MKYIVKVEQIIGSGADIKYRCLFERYVSDFENVSIEKVIEVLHILYVGLPHRILILFQS